MTDKSQESDAPPREWFINPVVGYKCEVNENGIGLTGNEIHVIEKAAYTEKCIELDRLKFTHQNTFEHWHIAIAQRDALAKERDEYVAEAEHFQHKCIDLDQANGILSKRIAELEALLEPSANKYYFDQMHKYWDESLALKEREQKLVAALKKAEAFLDETEPRSPFTGREAAALSTIRSVLKAHRGDG